MTAERPYITLSDLVKIQGFAITGGQAKQRVRDGGIQVDGVEEVRPGRKLFGGETVTVDGEKFGVSLGEGNPDADDDADEVSADQKKTEAKKSGGKKAGPSTPQGKKPEAKKSDGKKPQR